MLSVLIIQSATRFSLSRFILTNQQPVFSWSHASFYPISNLHSVGHSLQNSLLMLWEHAVLDSPNLISSAFLLNVRIPQTEPGGFGGGPPTGWPLRREFMQGSFLFGAWRMALVTSPAAASEQPLTYFLGPKIINKYSFPREWFRLATLIHSWPNLFIVHQLVFEIKYILHFYM